MSHELLSRTRPTTLRLAGFLTLAVGGALLGFGAVAEWARFEGFDAPTSGIDVWEGVVALAVALLSLIGLLAMRLVGPSVARAIVVVVVVGGLAAAGLAGADAVRARSRFTDPGQRDRIARELAARFDLPVEPIREAIEEQFQGRFSITLGPGIFLTIAGGALCVVGGILSWRWIALVEGREAATPRADETLDDDASG